MNPEMGTDHGIGQGVPRDVTGLDEGRTTYLPADVLRELNLEYVEEVPPGIFAAGSPKAGKKKTGSPKPGSPKPGSPKPGSPKPGPKKSGSPKR